MNPNTMGLMISNSTTKYSPNTKKGNKVMSTAYDTSNNKLLRKGTYDYNNIGSTTALRIKNSLEIQKISNAHWSQLKGIKLLRSMPMTNGMRSMLL